MLLQLLQQGAQDKQDKNGWTGLMIACRNGYTEIAELLLANGANKNAPK